MATINGGTGNDSIDGTSGADSLRGNGGNDTIEGGAGNDTIIGGSGNDSLDGWTGDDSIQGNSGEDTILGYDGRDTIDGGDGHDFIDGENDDDTLIGGLGDDTIEGGSGNDSIDGGEGSDELYGEAGADTMDGGVGQDWVDGGAGNDSLRGGSDADTVIGRSGDDTLHGDAGADIVSGHEGDDALHGGTGSDSLYGGSGEDYFDGGNDGDTDHYFMARSAGGGVNDPADTDRDVVRFEPGMGNDIAYDFEGEEDYIYIGATPEGDVVYTQIDADTWRLTFSGNATDSLTINFAPGTAPDSEGDLRNQVITDAEYTPPQNGQPAQWNLSCFTPRARVLTPSGLRMIRDLRPGDRIVTADHGDQPVLAILRRRIAPALLRAFPALRPVVIEAHAFGEGHPLRRLHVSRQHAFAARDGAALVRAIHLAARSAGVRVQDNRPNRITYMHIVLPRHELIRVEGVWTESCFCPLGGDGDLFGKTDPVARHMDRCRPLLTRADIRADPLGLQRIGRRAPQSLPSTRPEVLTASAPDGVRP